MLTCSYNFGLDMKKVCWHHHKTARGFVISFAKEGILGKEWRYIDLLSVVLVVTKRRNGGNIKRVGYLKDKFKLAFCSDQLGQRCEYSIRLDSLGDDRFSYKIKIVSEVIRPHDMCFMRSPTTSYKWVEERMGLPHRLKKKLFNQGMTVPSVCGLYYFT